MPCAHSMSCVFTVFDHYSEKKHPMHFYHALLVVLIGFVLVVDTSICERGFSLQNNLKTAKRNHMGSKLLRLLMTICSLGKHWEDPEQIPAARILAYWREASSRGRYENKLWSAEALEPGYWEEGGEGDDM